MISVYNESLICDCDGAEILRPWLFVVVCEHTSIHDDILSTLMVTVSGNPNPTNPTTKYRSEFVNLFCIYALYCLCSKLCTSIIYIYFCLDLDTLQKRTTSLIRQFETCCYWQQTLLCALLTVRSYWRYQKSSSPSEITFITFCASQTHHISRTPVFMCPTDE